MGFKVIEDVSSTLPDVPFISDWNKRKANDGTTFLVQHCIVSQKGIVLFTSEFKVFVWKSEKLCNVLLEHIGNSLDSDNPQSSVCILVAATTKKFFVAGFEDEVSGYWNADGSVYSFTEVSTVLSDSPTLPMDVKEEVDTRPKNGRRAS